MNAFSALYHRLTHKKSSYYRITGRKYQEVVNNTGLYGEYLIFRYLQNYEKCGCKFLFNVYIPKEDNETTELDVIMLSLKGIIVFESKNFSGWIFGRADRLKWMQTLPTGSGQVRKEHFYNPIMQNANHIKHLRAVVGDEAPIYSVIVFSERCTLMDIDPSGTNVPVIKRDHVREEVERIINDTRLPEISTDEIDRIYKLLLPLSSKDDQVKRDHIEMINRRFKKECAAPHADEEKAFNAPIVNTSVPTDPPPPVTAEAENKDAAAHCGESAVLLADIAGQEIKPLNDTGLGKCPRCGGQLVLRTAKKGANIGEQFIGCSRYPKCRYTQKKTP